MNKNKLLAPWIPYGSLGLRDSGLSPNRLSTPRAHSRHKFATYVTCTPKIIQKHRTERSAFTFSGQAEHRCKSSRNNFKIAPGQIQDTLMKLFLLLLHLCSACPENVNSRSFCSLFLTCFGVLLTYFANLCLECTFGVLRRFRPKPKSLRRRES